jgi:Txe/YoeB family toxin of Txe-Axe toxin-antitoxin module
MRIVAFHALAFDQYNEWALMDKKVLERWRRLISETAKTPFAGVGKPEPLKGDLKGYCWHPTRAARAGTPRRVASPTNIVLSTKRPMSN